MGQVAERDEGRRTAHTSLAADLGLPEYSDEQLRSMADAAGLPEPRPEPAGFWDDAVVVSVYTRQQAIEDGVLVDAHAGELGEVTRQHRVGRVPVVMTSGLFELIRRAVEHPRWGNDWKGVWHDVLWMSRHAAYDAAVKAEQNGGRQTFSVIITGTGRKQLHTLAVCWDGEAFTYMLPEED